MLRALEARISKLESRPEAKDITWMFADPGETREQTFARYGNPEENYVYMNFHGRGQDEKQD